MVKLQPNDPCWCGSGKKYKKCHKTLDFKLDAFRKEGYRVINTNLFKSEATIQKIRDTGILVHDTLDMIGEFVKSGVSTEEINQIVHDFTIKNNAVPAPLNYHGFPKSCCTSVNDVICHGIPNKSEILKDGDIINIDITSIRNGVHADSSRMYLVGDVSEEARKLVEVTKECLMIGIDEAKPFTPLNNVGIKIQEHAQMHNYSVVRDYCGHGIGESFHEQPEVVHYASREKGFILAPGMVFTIEPMINAGNFKSKLLKDNWTAMTNDGSLSAQWEHTILITENGAEILT